MAIPKRKNSLNITQSLHRLCETVMYRDSQIEKKVWKV